MSDKLKNKLSMLDLKVNRTGYSVSSNVYFTLESMKPVSKDDAYAVQLEKSSYHPLGYGFYGYKTKYDPILMRHITTWHCQGSCD